MSFLASIVFISSLIVSNALISKSCFGSRTIHRTDCCNYSSNKITQSTSLSAAKYDLVVWDCDGVLVDSEALLKMGEVKALAQLGYKLTANDCTRMFSGVSIDQAMENFKKEMNADLPSNFFRDQVENSLDLFRRELKPLMKETVLSLYNEKVPMCVASGSRRDRVLLSIEVGGMGHCFKEDEVFTRELVAKGKPAPDLFLYSAEKMGIAPEKCIVIEDSTSGVEAALAAGMHCISFLGGGHAQEKWYQDKILSYQGAPAMYTQEEVFAYIKSVV